MVHDQWLTPLRPIRTRLVRAVANSSIDHKVVNLVLAELVERLLREFLHIAKVRQLKRQDRNLIGALVVANVAIRFLGGLRVACAKDNAVGLSLLQELLDSLKALI